MPTFKKSFLQMLEQRRAMTLLSDTEVSNLHRNAVILGRQWRALGDIEVADFCDLQAREAWKSIEARTEPMRYLCTNEGIFLLEELVVRHDRPKAA
jgi:hypothetical protein